MINKSSLSPRYLLGSLFTLQCIGLTLCQLLLQLKGHVCLIVCRGRWLLNHGAFCTSGISLPCAA